MIPAITFDVRAFVQACGGAKVIAEQLGHPEQRQVVYAWQRRGVVPLPRLLELLPMAGGSLDRFLVRG